MGKEWRATGWPVWEDEYSAEEIAMLQSLVEKALEPIMPSDAPTIAWIDNWREAIENLVRFAQQMQRSGAFDERHQK